MPIIRCAQSLSTGTDLFANRLVVHTTHSDLRIYALKARHNVNNNDNDIKAQCPTCGRDVPYTHGDTDDYFPFCSRRCKLIDLGKWFDEEHRIEGTLQDRMPEGAGDNESEQQDNGSDIYG